MKAAEKATSSRSFSPSKSDGLSSAKIAGRKLIKTLFAKSGTASPAEAILRDRLESAIPIRSADLGFCPVAKATVPALFRIKVRTGDPSLTLSQKPVDTRPPQLRACRKGRRARRKLRLLKTPVRSVPR